MYLSMVLAGCGAASGPQRASLSGTITLDGTALERGVISLVPIAGTKGPTAGVEIVAGKYTIAQSTGPVPGHYRVEITANRKTGKIRDEGGMVGKVEVTEQYIPAKYNTASTLELDIVAGSNSRDFKL